MSCAMGKIVIMSENSSYDAMYDIVGYIIVIALDGGD